MRIDTSSGIHGMVITYHAISHGERASDGVAIVRRDNATEPHRPYSVHTVYRDPDAMYAANGAYDLSLPEAQVEFERRTGITFA